MGKVGLKKLVSPTTIRKRPRKRTYQARLRPELPCWYVDDSRDGTGCPRLIGPMTILALVTRSDGMYIKFVDKTVVRRDRVFAKSDDALVFFLTESERRLDMLKQFHQKGA